MASVGWGFNMRLKHEHTHKVSRPARVAQVAEGIFRGPKGPGVPPTAVQMPKRIGSTVKPPRGRKTRG